MIKCGQTNFLTLLCLAVHEHANTFLGGSSTDKGDQGVGRVKGHHHGH